MARCGRSVVHPDILLVEGVINRLRKVLAATSTMYKARTSAAQSVVYLYEGVVIRTRTPKPLAWLCSNWRLFFLRLLRTLVEGVPCKWFPCRYLFHRAPLE